MAVRRARRTETPGGPATMKVATWNVNGIRARRAGARPDRPRAARRGLPAGDQGDARAGSRHLCDHPRYWCYWHGAGGYSGVGLHVSKERAGEAPRSRIRPSTTRRASWRWSSATSSLASVYVPNGGKDFAAKMAFLEALAGYVASVHERGRRLVLCGDINVAREERDVHPKERKPTPSASAPTSARSSSGCSGTAWSTSAAPSTPTTTSSSPGGRRGATCASATSAGGSTTFSPATRSRGRPRRA